jgi:hypothetical protein
MKIYDYIPMSEDKRADFSADLFADLLKNKPY